MLLANRVESKTRQCSKTYAAEEEAAEEQPEHSKEKAISDNDGKFILAACHRNRFYLKRFSNPFSIDQYKMQCFIYDSFLSIAIFLSTQVRYDGKLWLSYLHTYDFPLCFSEA